MTVENNIYRENFGAPYEKVGFVVAMIDDSGSLRKIPFPPVQGMYSDEVIYGIKFMVNPASISNNMARIVTRAQTMTGFVEEHWGEELDTITFQGNTAAFVTGAQDLREARSQRVYNQDLEDFYSTVDLTTTTDLEVGLTTSKRRLSVSYRHFKRLVDLFRVNGCFFDRQGFISRRLYIMLSYGYSSYKGFFESIDITEEATNPFRFTYTITFKSESTIYSYINQKKTGV